MTRQFCSALVLAALMLGACPKQGLALFFTGSPTANYLTTSGTVTNTPLVVPNNPNMELDVNGQFIVTNATPPVQTSSFEITCPLDTTFNGGSPISIQLQINQNGFVTVPAGGQIYGWTLQADLVDYTGVGMGGLTIAPSPSPNYGPGTTTYGPTTTFGPTFTYNPAIGSIMDLKFTSNFDGLVPANSYTWDFPLTVKAVVVPEPATLSLIFVPLALMRRRRRA